MPRWLLLLIVAISAVVEAASPPAATPAVEAASPPLATPGVEAASPPLISPAEATASLRAVDWNLPDLPKLPGLRTLGHPSIHRDATPPFVRFNGRDDGYVVDLNPIAGWKTFTIQVWIRPDPKGPPAQRFLHIEGQADTRLTLETRITPDGHWYLDTYLRGPRDHRPLIDPRLTHDAGVWSRVELRYDGRTMSSWVDGKQELSAVVAFPAMTPGQISLGVRLNRVYWFQGDLARVRFLPSAPP